jgi:hypothetical protein
VPEQTKIIRTQEIPLKKANRYKGTRRGFFIPAHPEKYEGNVRNICYRSKMELKMMEYLDDQPSVLKWSSEEIVIPYQSPIDGKIHKYFIDFKSTVKKRDGKITTFLMEVKWSTACAPPKVPKKRTIRYLTELRNWEVNQAKWAQAEKLCTQKGWVWLIITEKQLTF